MRVVKSDQSSPPIPRVTFLGPKNQGSFPCLWCIQCSSMMKGKGFSYPQKGYDISIRDYYTCQSTYVIYIIKCLCGLLYVGETTQKIIALRDISTPSGTNQRNCLYRDILQIRAIQSPNLDSQCLTGFQKNRRGGNRELELKKKEVH